MTTDNETQRDISVLLEMDSYQGMTDKEIETLIDYKEKSARLEAMRTALEQNEADNRAAFDKVISDMRDVTRTAFVAAVENTPDFKRVNVNG